MSENLQKGLLVVADGPSGSGKDSLLNALSAQLHTLCLPVFCFSEEETDEKRHEILEARRKGKERGGTGDIEMAGILVEHRKEIYQNIVEPRVVEGKMVIANRGEPATLAYQTARGELTMEDVWDMHRESGVRIPDLVILTICSAETATQRLEADRAESAIRRERETGGTLSGKITEEKDASRAEKVERGRKIHEQYRATETFLEQRGVSVLTLDTERMSVEEEVKVVLDYLKLK